MAVACDIFSNGAGHFRFDGCGGIIVFLGGAAGLGACDIAFMEQDCAAGTYFDIDASAFGLGAFFILPVIEIGSALHQDNAFPAIGFIFCDLRGDGFALCSPEGFGISKDAVLSKEVGDDLSVIGFKIEQSAVSRDHVPACHPCFAILASRRVVGF